MSTSTTAAPRGARSSLSVIELEIAAESGPGWLGSGAEPVTVSLTAETVRFEGDRLHFVIGGAIVRTVPRGEVAALTWRGSPPRGRAPGPHRNAGAVWSEQERARLTAEVLGDLSWIEISHRHERTVSAVRREAVRMRLVDELGRRLDEPAAHSAAAIAAAAARVSGSMLAGAPSPSTAPPPGQGRSGASPAHSTLVTPSAASSPTASRTSAGPPPVR
jgi:hypothetical protein